MNMQILLKPSLNPFKGFQCSEPKVQALQHGWGPCTAQCLLLILHTLGGFYFACWLLPGINNLQTQKLSTTQMLYLLRTTQVSPGDVLIVHSGTRAAWASPPGELLVVHQRGKDPTSSS